MDKPMEKPKELLTMRGGHMIQGLHDLIKYVGIDKDMPVVEIGTFAGESAQIFAEYASLVYTIDPWVPYAEGMKYGLDVGVARQWFFEHVMAKDIENRIKPLQVYSAQAIRMFDDYSIPLLYVDGYHKFAMNDVDLWWNKIVDNGYIAGHDYNEERFPEIIAGIAQRFGGPDAVFQDESWVVKKTDEHKVRWNHRYDLGILGGA